MRKPVGIWEAWVPATGGANEPAHPLSLLLPGRHAGVGETAGSDSTAGRNHGCSGHPRPPQCHQEPPDPIPWRQLETLVVTGLGVGALSSLNKARCLTTSAPSCLLSACLSPSVQKSGTRAVRCEAWGLLLLQRPILKTKSLGLQS